MLNRCDKGISKLLFTLVNCCFILTVGCAAGVTKVVVEHDPLEKISDQKNGKILVKTFKDERKDTNYIGNKRNGFGQVLGHIGIFEDIQLEKIVTEYFAEALEEAGYETIIEQPESNSEVQDFNFDAIVEGKIVEFWLDFYMAAWHYMTVNVVALDKNTQNVLWEKEISSGEKNVLWIGATAEFEKVIRESLTKSLNQAAAEFASNAFYDAIERED